MFMKLFLLGICDKITNRDYAYDTQPVPRTLYPDDRSYSMDKSRYLRAE